MRYTITFDQISTYNVLFDEFSSQKPAPIVFEGDPLAAAVVLYEHRRTGSNICHSGEHPIISPEMQDAITPEIRELTEKVRQYYVNKLTMKAMMTGHLSVFRSDILSIINGSKFDMTRENLDMLFKLPDFYEYDTAQEVINSKLTGFVDIAFDSAEARQTFMYDNLDLQHVGTLTRRAKNRPPRLQYIFQGFDRDGVHPPRPILIEQHGASNLVPIMDFITLSKKRMLISGSLRPRRIATSWYYGPISQTNFIVKDIK